MRAVVSLQISRHYEDRIIETYSYGRNNLGSFVVHCWHLPDGEFIFNEKYFFNSDEEGNNHYRALRKQGFSIIANYLVK